MLLVEFSIQLARVNCIQAKVQLIQLLCGKYLQAHGLSCQSHFWALNLNNYMSLYASGALTQIINR